MRLLRLTHALALALFACASTAARAQTPSPSPPATPRPAAEQQEEPDEVLTVSSELVQTTATVVDGKGKFVGGLRREQFQMLIDGRPQPISFFEQAETGTPAGRERRAAATGAVAPATDASASARGRTVFLFADDLHISNSTYAQARKALLRYVDQLMGDDDQAAVVSASGQLGFLQQLTDDKSVLRAAISRLNFQPSDITDTGSPPMSAYQAIAIQERDDPEILEYLVRETLALTPGIPRNQVESLVRSRARVVSGRSAAAARATLASLERLLRSSARLPGRKVVIFISEGFILQLDNSDSAEWLRRMTDAAARADAVVYTVDARGLATDPAFEAGGGRVADLTSLGLRHGTSELHAQQEPLFTIADETGGRAVVNTNDLVGGMAGALEETSRYYLIAWQPTSEENRGGKFRRIEIRIADRPDLIVRLHKGYLVADTAATAKKEKPPATPAPARDDLRDALSSVFPVRQLPLDLSVVFVDAPDKGAVVTASAGVPAYALSFKGTGGGQSAAVELACALFDEHGKVAQSARQRLDLSGGSDAAASQAEREIAYNFQFSRLPPGIYQARVAARDAGSGRVGSVARWIEVPNLRKGRLTLSSLLVGGVRASAGRDAKGAAESKGVAESKGGEPLDLNAGRRFSKDERLGFYTYIYNAARGAGRAPDLAVRLQVRGGGRVLIDSGERVLAAEGAPDPARLPYGADIGLAALSPGRYLLEVTVTDRRSQATATQSARFEIK